MAGLARGNRRGACIRSIPPVRLRIRTRPPQRIEIDCAALRSAQSGWNLRGRCRLGRISHLRMGIRKARHAGSPTTTIAAAGRSWIRLKFRWGAPRRTVCSIWKCGKADFAEISPEEARRADRTRRARQHVGHRRNSSRWCLSPRVAPIAEDAHAREALARSIDRRAIVNFILQKEGEPAGGLLPQWSNGTAFLFPTAAGRRRRERVMVANQRLAQDRVGI